jgi:hypothetical protein
MAKKPQKKVVNKQKKSQTTVYLLSIGIIAAVILVLLISFAISKSKLDVKDSQKIQDARVVDIEE